MLERFSEVCVYCWRETRARNRVGSAVVTIQKDLAYVLVTFTELKSASGYLLKVDGKELDQSVH